MILAGLSLLTAGIWIASARWSVVLQGDTFQTGVGGGVWMLAYRRGERFGFPNNGLHLDRWMGGFRWGIKLALPERFSTMYTARVPLWMPAAALALYPALALALCRRRGPMACSACGYSLQGLAPGTTCPECGAGPGGGG
jgi:hypothetical protein